MPPSVRRFASTAFRPEIVRRACLTALVVGTLLAAINHGAEVLALDVDGARALRIALTYAVPYCVSTFAATMQELRHRAGVEAKTEATKH